LPLNKFFGLQR